MTPKGFCKKYQTNGFVSPILANPTTLSLSMDHICIFIFQSAWTFLGHFIYSLKSGSYFSLCLIFLPKNTHNKNVFSVNRSRRKKDNHAAFHISYKNISKKAVDLSLYITSLFGKNAPVYSWPGLLLWPPLAISKAFFVLRERTSRTYKLWYALSSFCFLRKR